MTRRHIRSLALTAAILTAAAPSGCGPADEGTISVPGNAKRTLGATTDPNLPAPSAVAPGTDNPGNSSTLKLSQGASPQP